MCMQGRARGLVRFFVYQTGGQLVRWSCHLSYIQKSSAFLLPRSRMAVKTTSIWSRVISTLHSDKNDNNEKDNDNDDIHNHDVHVKDDCNDNDDDDDDDKNVVDEN